MSLAEAKVQYLAEQNRINEESALSEEELKVVEEQEARFKNIGWSPVNGFFFSMLVRSLLVGTSGCLVFFRPVHPAVQMVENIIFYATLGDKFLYLTTRKSVVSMLVRSLVGPRGATAFFKSVSCLVPLSLCKAKFLPNTMALGNISFMIGLMLASLLLARLPIYAGPTHELAWTATSRFFVMQYFIFEVGLCRT
jgi:hypothetical protein